MGQGVTPEDDDVIVREKHGNPSSVYLLGTSATPDQYMLRSRDEAVSQALAFAKRQGVRAWFAKAGNELLLLGTFRQDEQK